MIFVFGSNLRGIHGAGAARDALKFHGAKLGKGEGIQGNSYALPTCSIPGEPLLLEQIQTHVQRFLEYARSCPDFQFQVTRVGCGFAGYTDADIAPMFLNPPDNVWLPGSFVRILQSCEY